MITYKPSSKKWSQIKSTFSDNLHMIINKHLKMLSLNKLKESNNNQSSKAISYSLLNIFHNVKMSSNNFLLKNSENLIFLDLSLLLLMFQVTLMSLSFIMGRSLLSTPCQHLQQTSINTLSSSYKHVTENLSNNSTNKKLSWTKKNE